MWFSSVLLFVAIFGLAGAWNALRPAHIDRPPRRRPPWIFAMLTGEAVLVRIVIFAVLVTITWLLGGLRTPAGQVSLVMLAVTFVLYVVVLRRSLAARSTMRTALAEVGVEMPKVRFRWLEMIRAWPFRVPADIERTEGIVFAPGLQLDVYRRVGHEGKAPALLQIHGGGWRGGNRRQQARPLINHMVRQGWIAVSIDYPKVPAATFPDQIVGIKQALGWMRTHGEAFGIDAARIAITGGSAGAHLAALTALTANRPEYQPGFGQTNTSVAACVPFYGIFDLLNRNRTREDWPVVARGLLKSSKETDEDRWRKASPYDQVRTDAPPFLIIHGENDSLVGKEESEHFAKALRLVSGQPVALAVLPGATHSFDIIPSPRTQIVAHGVAAFLEKYV